MDGGRSMLRHIRALLLIALVVVGGVVPMTASAGEPNDLKRVEKLVDDAVPNPQQTPIVCYQQHHWPYAWVCVP